MIIKTYILDKYYGYIIFIIHVYCVAYLLYVLLSQPFASVRIFEIPIYFTLLGLIYASYLLFRLAHAWMWTRYIHKIRPQLEEKYENCKKVKVGVCVPIYNEKTHNVKKTITSLLKQTHSLTYVYLIDDGSKNQKEVKKLIQSFTTNKIVAVYLKKNNGKRIAMFESYRRMKDDGCSYMVTVDSDTVISVTGVKELLATLWLSSNIGSVTGNVLSKNADSPSILQKMIAMRYLYAFSIERASQSNYGSVQCNSGPFTIYRIDVLDKIMSKFVNQRFLNQQATFGDDRHLTNRVLELGYKSIYQPMATAYTDTPSTIRGYWKQQIRWTKSYIREIFWQLKTARSQSIFMSYDLAIGIILPFFLLFSYIHAILSLLVPSVEASMLSLDMEVNTQYNFALFLIMILSIAFCKGLYLKWYMGSKYAPRVKGYNNIIRYVLSYGFLYFILIIFAKPIAIFTPRDITWGTRG